MSCGTASDRACSGGLPLSWALTMVVIACRPWCSALCKVAQPAHGLLAVVPLLLCWEHGLAAQAEPDHNQMPQACMPCIGQLGS